MVFFTILLGLFPSFLMVVLGGVIRNRLSVNAWQGLDRLNFEILFPTLIFVAASSRPILLADIVRIGPAVWADPLRCLVPWLFGAPFWPRPFHGLCGGMANCVAFQHSIGVRRSRNPERPSGGHSGGGGRYGNSDGQPVRSDGVVTRDRQSAPDPDQNRDQPVSAGVDIGGDCRAVGRHDSGTGYGAA